MAKNGITQLPPVLPEIKYIGYMISELFDHEEYNIIIKFKSLIRVSKDYVKISLEDDARLNVRFGRDSTYDIGIPYKDMSKEIKEIYSKAGYFIYQDKHKNSKFDVTKNKRQTITK